MPDFELARPTSLKEALGLIDSDDPDIRPMGGGTALALMMKARFLRPVRLVSLCGIAELSGIEIDRTAAEIRIGATTTFSALEHSDELAAEIPVVRRAMRDLANVRVRHVATVGGNLAHADPHLDLPPIWAALGAEATLTSLEGERVVPVEEIALGYYETVVREGEIISGIKVPLRRNWHSKYVKVTTRAAHDWPALGLAISVHFEGPAVAESRLVVSAATDRPIRLLRAEAELAGAGPGSPAIDRAIEAAIDEAAIESDGRGSSDYKNHLLKVHLGRALHSLATEIR